jgi:polar amino acid transport system substrate-binding protein
MNRSVFGTILASVFLAILAACSPGSGTTDKKEIGSQDTLARIRKEGVLKWGAAATGGAPFVYFDDKDPNNERIIGFEMDIADGLAKHLGLKMGIANQEQWDTLLPNLDARRSDAVMNGIEMTAERKEKWLFTEPYYVYEQMLTVKAADKDKYRTLDDLKGKKVGVLGGTEAQRILERQGWVVGDTIMIHDDSLTPYENLRLGRIEAVLQENIIAWFYSTPERFPELFNIPQTFAPGKYAIACRKGDETLAAELDRALNAMKKSGELAEIYRKWKIFTPAQKDIGVMENTEGAKK